MTDHAETLYHANGKIKQTNIVLEDNNRVIENYDEDGTLLSRTINIYEGDATYSTYWEYFANGHLKMKSHYTNSVRTGPFETYYEDGSLKVKGQYKDDKVDGIIEITDPDGQVMKAKLNEDGNLELYDEDGILESKIHIGDDTDQDQKMAATLYASDGSVERQGHFTTKETKDNHVDYEFHDDDGKLIEKDKIKK